MHINIAEKISIKKVLESLGVKHVVSENPFDLKKAISAVNDAANFKGVSAVIFEAPCIAMVKPSPSYTIDLDKCAGCNRCIKELGCPGTVKDGKKVRIDKSLCYGCSICSQVCPVNAIGGAQK